MSVMSWLILVISRLLRFVSIAKLRSTGCVYCASQFELYNGLYVAFSDVVDCLLLLKLPRKLPPCQGTCWLNEPLKVAVLALMVEPIAPPPVVLVTDEVWLWVVTVEETVGL